MAQSGSEQPPQESTPKRELPPEKRGLRARARKKISAFLSKIKVEIHTGGGAYVEGNVNTSGGKFVGRDSITIGTVTIETRHLAFALVMIAILVLLYLIYFRPFGEKPIVPMGGDFNITVAAFSRVDSSPSLFPKSNRLADEVYQALESQLQPLQEAGFNVELRGPQQVDAIQGETALERARNAEAVAQAHDADLVIYGVLRLEPNQTSLQPELYVKNNKLYKAEEAAGQYTFGSPLTVANRIDRNPVASSVLSKSLNTRVVSLVHFVIGLGYFSLSKYDDATTYFEQANQQSLDGGKEQAVILLFQGSVAAKRRNLPLAADYYRKALAVDDQYARAQLGLSQTFFLRSRDGCQPGQVDIAGLAAAEEGYQKARTMPDPPLADIDIKARLMLAKVYLCQSSAGIGDRWIEAKDNLESVIRSYEAAPEENNRIQYIAADAASVLALSYTSRGESNSLTLAAEFWDKALEWSQNPARRAVYLAGQAWIHLQRSECDLAQADMAASQGQYEEFKKSNPTIEDDEYLHWFKDVEAVEKEKCSAPGG